MQDTEVVKGQEVRREGRLCRGQDTLLSLVGKLRFMQPGCRAWIHVMRVAGDRLRLEAWGLHVS